MGRMPQLLDQFGRPVERRVLTREVATARIGSVRNPISGTPADGLDPVRLAQILRAADLGDPVQYLELAEVSEERNAHYLGVLGTRKRSVSQIKIRVEPASDKRAHTKHAERIEGWLKRQELQGELFDILDAIGKGYSFTEIIWDTSARQWEPRRLEWRDPRWFGFDRSDLTTPMMLDEHGQHVPMPGYKFVFACMKAKSGLTLRSGLARVALWNWLFKSFTEKDWAIFSQTYGQPLRVGKWGPGASEDDKRTLFQAVANIAGDCAAIIPESMMIDFVETGNLSATGQLYKDRVDYLDRQISKAVLGQTATTDADTGGLGSGKEHRQVQEDIERADAMALSAILNEQLIRPWINLEFGRQDLYPTLKIEDEEPEDLAALSSALGPFIDRGLRVSTSEILGKFKLTEPQAEDEILRPMGQKSPSEDENDTEEPPSEDEVAPQSAVKYPFNTHRRRRR